MTSVVEQDHVSSLMELQSRHALLVESASSDSDSDSDSVDTVHEFIHVCEKAGHVLDCPTDRSSAQSLITYWVNRLARRARKASKSVSEDSDISLDTDDEATETNESVKSDSGRNDQGLLAEFDQDAFNQLVLVPTELWLESLSADDQTLVRRIVLRLLTLRSDGTFEPVPNTQVIVEDLEPADRALQILETLVRKGVVRRQRHSLKLEEYTLQSLARLKYWPSLQLWMEQRKRFRDLAEETLRKQQAEAASEKFQPLVDTSRLLRKKMTDFGAVLQKYIVLTPGLAGLYRDEAVILTDEEMAEAEFYRDKNSVEAKAIYSKRQLERMKSETTQERLFGVSCALIILAFATTIAIYASLQAVRAYKTADKTRKSNTLLLAGFASSGSSMSRDPSGALLRSLNAYSEFEESKSVIPTELAQQCQESNLLSLGAAQLQAPVLVDLIHRPVAQNAMDSQKVVEKTSSKTERSAQVTLLSDSGEVCLMVDFTTESNLGRPQLTCRVFQTESSGTWSDPLKTELELPPLRQGLSEPKVQAFISHDGGQAAVAVTVKETDSSNESSSKIVSYLFAGASFEKLEFIRELPTVQTACFDRNQRFFAIACETPADKKNSDTTIWSTSEWDAPIADKVAVNGQITALAFSKEMNNAGRNSNSPSYIRLAAVTGYDQLAVVQQLTFPTLTNPDEATKVSKSSQPAVLMWQQVLSRPLDTDSRARLVYSPQTPDLLFFSQDANHFLIRTDLSQSRSLPLDPVLLQSQSPKDLACSSVAFSPDGKKLAIGMRYGKIAMWHIDSDKFIGPTIAQFDSPDKESGKKFVEASWVQSISMSTHPQHSEEVFGVRFSPDNKYLISASRDKLVQVYDTLTRQLAAPPIVHHATVNTASVTLNGRFLTTVARDIVFSWEFPTTRWLPKSFGIPHGRTVLATARTGKGFLVVGGRRAEAGLQRGWIRMIDIRDGQEVNQEIDLPRPVQQLAVHGDGKWIFAIDDNGAAYIINDLGDLLWKQAADQGYAKFGVFDNDPQRIQLLICFENRTGLGGSKVQIVRVSGAAIQVDPTCTIASDDPTETLTSASFDPWGTGFAVGTSQGKMFYGSVTNEPVIPLTVNGAPPHNERITHLVFNRQSQLLICGSEDDNATIWSLENAAWHSNGTTLEADNTANINHVAISDSGEKFALASADGQATIWGKSTKGKYQPIHKIKQATQSQGAMIDVGFLGQDNERYVYCRWSDRSLRVFDALHVPSPLKADELLLEGREVASFEIPHSVDNADVSVDAQQNWTVTATGYVNYPTPVPSNETGIKLRDELFSWNAQVELSQWKFKAYSPEKLSDLEAMEMATVLSGRRAKDKLGQLESIPEEELLRRWDNGLRPFELRAPSLLTTIDWHKREAENSLYDQFSGSKIAVEHWSKIDGPDQTTLSAHAYLQFAKAQALQGEWNKAREILTKAEAGLANNIDFLETRAAVNVCEFLTAAGRQGKLMENAVEDYQKALELRPKDLVIRARLAEAFKILGDNKSQFQELDQIIEASPENMRAIKFKERGALRQKLGQDWRLILQDFRKAGELFVQERSFKEATGEYQGAVTLFEKNMPQRNDDERRELARLYESMGDAWRQISMDKASEPKMRHAYLQACQQDSDNLLLMLKFFNSLEDSRDIDNFDGSWREIDVVFQRALAIDNANVIVHRQRIEALLPDSKSALDETDRLDFAIEAFKEMKAQVGISATDQLNWAAIYIYRNRIVEAEEVLRKAWQDFPEISLVGVRLGLVLAMQNKLEELRQLVTEMVGASSTASIDRNNAAWTAIYSPQAWRDTAQIVSLAEMASSNFSSDPTFLNTLGAAYMRAGNLEKAKEAFANATSQRNELPDNEVNKQEKLFGNAMDLLLSSMAQLIAKNGAEANELLQKAEWRFKEYDSHEHYTDFYSWVWNVREYELFLNEMKHQPEL